ncbi:MAG: hypothetical protein RLN96_10260, partial [Pseudomonadales bacterium]
ALSDPTGKNLEISIVFRSAEIENKTTGKKFRVRLIEPNESGTELVFAEKPATFQITQGEAPFRTKPFSIAVKIDNCNVCLVWENFYWLRRYTERFKFPVNDFYISYPGQQGSLTKTSIVPIVIEIDERDYDLFDVAAHEFGHLVLQSAYRGGGDPDLYMDDQEKDLFACPFNYARLPSPAMAWAEGWADFFALTMKQYNISNYTNIERVTTSTELVSAWKKMASLVLMNLKVTLAMFMHSTTIWVESRRFCGISTMVRMMVRPLI